MMNHRLPKHDVVVLGAGHTNAHVLRMWRMNPLADVRLTCVSDFPWATYSGMLPATLAGLYPPERMQIDLVRLTTAVGARLICARVTGVDVANRQLLLDDRPPLPFDVLSIGIGSVPNHDPQLTGGKTVVPIKPMQTFVHRLETSLARAQSRVQGRPLHVAVVGAGAAGIEITFCLAPRLKSQLGTAAFDLTLVDANSEVGRGLPENTTKRILREFEQRGVRLALGHRVQRIGDDHIELEGGQRLPADLVLWATTARAPDLLRKIDLPKDDAGFLLTRASLQTVSDDPIFAVGDTGSIDGARTPKAGVYAVRQGPVLWENIARLLRRESLVEYQPQHDFLKLFCTGDRRAILSYQGVSFHAGWCWKLKNFIDGRFMDKYQDYAPMEMSAAAPNGEAEMRCAGCGGKVGGSILARVLERLDIPPSEHVLVGLEQPDDAAVVATPSQGPVTITADFFAAPLDDPYLVGRIAALNAASDLFALGAKPYAAIALATVPVGDPRQQEQLLYELLAGSLHEFRQMGATLVGGHTIEGSQVTIGFTMLGDSAGKLPRTKSGLRAGDTLILTKPLGTGILLAAAMQAKCRAEWMQPLIACMLQSNGPPAALIDEFDIQGVTDVTGFGLAGHLLEMLKASDVAVELRLEDIPLLPGVGELVAAQIESTLAPANRAAEAETESTDAARRTPPYAALFDPQTSGGLLLGVPEQHVKAVLERLRDQSATPAAIIGRVVRRNESALRIRLR